MTLITSTSPVKRVPLIVGFPTSSSNCVSQPRCLGVLVLLDLLLRAAAKSDDQLILCILVTIPPFSGDPIFQTTVSGKVFCD